MTRTSINVGTTSRLLGRSERKQVTISRLLDAPDYGGLFKLCTWRELYKPHALAHHQSHQHD
jgi:hypothetical protein